MPQKETKLLPKTFAVLLAFATGMSAASQLVLSTTSIGPVQILPGSNGTSQTVEASNAGTGSLNLTAAVSAPWLAATVGAARTCPTGGGTCNPITIALNTSALTAGTYTGYVSLTDPNAIDSPQQISVTVNVAGVPSSLTFYLTPAGGPNASASQRIYTSGSVTGKVTTQSGGTWLSLVSGAPFFSGYAVQVTAQPGQATGSYIGSIALSGASTQTINVTLNVTSSPIVQLVTSPVTLSGPGSNASATVSLTNVGEGTLNITGATASSTTGSFLSASVASPNSITIAANPGSLSPGYYTGSVTLTSNAANNSQISVPVVYTAETAGTPVINSEVVNIGNFAPGSASPGEILTIFGDQLAPAGSLNQNSGPPPLATTLGTAQVLVNGVPAPLYFTSPSQVAFQLPYEAPVGQVSTVQVVLNNTPGNLRPINVVATAPVALIWPASVIAGGYGIVTNTDYSLVLPSPVTGFTTHPAKVGDTVTIYCEGLGETSPPAITGAAASSTTLEEVANVTVTFGGGFTGNAVTVPAAFAGLTPTAVGLYQVDATIPAGTPTGSAVPLTINLSGVSSNAANIAVQ